MFDSQFRLNPDIVEIGDRAKLNELRGKARKRKKSSKIYRTLQFPAFTRLGYLSNSN